ncbi:hypothetical protein [Moraxella caviae]|uniref:hypothetical protein n=1 Tax=Moraxella caviae TaxID=34060 RepID=UPI0013EF67B4|nr:hypothetical protein [Moraxella caviae]
MMVYGGGLRAEILGYFQNPVETPTPSILTQSLILAKLGGKINHLKSLILAKSGGKYRV